MPRLQLLQELNVRVDLLRLRVEGLDAITALAQEEVVAEGDTASASAGEPKSHDGALESVRVEFQAPMEPQYGGIRRAGAVESIICSYSWNCATALRIVYGPTAACPTGESGGNPRAFNRRGYGHYGLWEISAIHAYRWPDFWEAWADPVKNTAWAWELYQEQGWEPWACY